MTGLRKSFKKYNINASQLEIFYIIGIYVSKYVSQEE